MRNPFRLLLLAILAAPLCAQEDPAYGFLNVVNLIPHEDPCMIQIGGKELVPDGLKAGLDTGWFMVPVGKQAVTIRLGEDLDAGSGEIEIVEGLSTLVAIYLHPDPRRKPDGKAFPPRIRIKREEAYLQPKGHGLKFVSLCPGVNRFQIGPNLHSLDLFEAVEIPRWTGGGFEISRDGKAIGKVTGPKEAGAYFLMAGTDHQGNFLSTIVRSDRQEAPPWMRKKTKP